jgi:hypothetical protein
VTALDDLVVLVLDHDTVQAILDRNLRLARDIGNLIEARRKALQAVRSIHPVAAPLWRRSGQP